MKRTSIIVPCFNEEESLPHFYQEITRVMDLLPEVEPEFVFVDDGSTDKTAELCRKLSERDERVKYIIFSRNFGKEAAMIAGMEHATGDYVAIMDADLQDPPELLVQMHSMIDEKKLDCVATRRLTRKGEPIIRSFFAKTFYKLINLISKTPIVDGARDFRLMTRQMVDAIIALPEYNRFSKGIFQWVGFNTEWIAYENIERQHGQTKWSFWKLFLYSIDGMVAFSTAPLALASLLGVLISGCSFLLGLYYILQKLIVGNEVKGYPTLIVVILFLGGLQLLCIGILGQYLSKTYMETKGRPKYIVKESRTKKLGQTTPPATVRMVEEEL